MTFVDTNVFLYAVGGAHPLREGAVEFFLTARRSGDVALCTSAEVLQELLHVYLPQGRMADLDAALQLATDLCVEIWPLEADDVLMSIALATTYPALSARDLAHLASCRRRGITRIETYDRPLAAAFA